MPLSDVLAAALSRPAGHVVEGPVRTIVQEVLQDHGYATPAEVQGLRDQISRLSKRLDGLAGVVEAGQQAAEAATAEVETLRAGLEQARAQASAADERASRAEALAVAADSRIASMLERATAVEAEVAVAERRARMAESRLEEALTLELNTRDLQAVAPIEDPADAALDEPPAAASTEPARAVPELTQAPCLVDGCAALSGTDGFCLAHHQDWVSGRLPGVVSPEGLVEVDGRPYTVAEELAGRPYRITGTKLRRVQVDGRFVKKKAL